ncbi:MAG: hypothetical protein H6839_14960 [Planctomycetes bacterium]|nr:hypothetical protein [Planctomycetota bacterium]
MSRYPNVRPKPARHQPPKSAAPSREQQVELSIQQAASQLYAERDGHSIDASITRYENLLKLHDEEMLKLHGKEDQPYRWKVAPTVVIRISREIERLQQRREELKEDCFRIAHQMIQDWMQGGEAREEIERVAAEAGVKPPSTPETAAPDGVAERSTADALTHAV